MHKVGKASKKVFGITKRDELIRVRLTSRKRTPKFETGPIQRIA